MSHTEVETGTKRVNTPLLMRGVIWIAIGALIAAALVCVVWVLVGNQDGLIGRAFLTIMLLAGFAGIAVLEVGLSPDRPQWLSLASMITWIVALIVGAVKIWLPADPDDYFGTDAAERFFQLLLVVAVLQLALLHVRLFTKAAQRNFTSLTQVIYMVTLALLIALVAMVVFALTFPDTFTYADLYWRVVVALTILVAVGTTMIPLLNALFAPRKERPEPVIMSGPPKSGPWPTYADGVTPLPAMYDGTPDWHAYMTGFPSVQHGQPAAGSASAYVTSGSAPQSSPLPEAPAPSPVPQAQSVGESNTAPAQSPVSDVTLPPPPPPPAFPPGAEGR